jgi:alpha-galactosidase
VQVGNIGLTLAEQYTHMTLWCIAGAPLLAGTDLIHATNETLAILANVEVTAINQDLGKDGAIQGVLLTKTAWLIDEATVDPEVTTEVWAKHLADESVAVALVNLGDAPADIQVAFADLGLTGPAAVRDLWKKADLGVKSGSYTAAAVPSHGAVFLKFRGQ